MLLEVTRKMSHQSDFSEGSEVSDACTSEHVWRGSVRLTYRKPPHPLLLLANLRQLMLPWQHSSSSGKRSPKMHFYLFSRHKEGKRGTSFLNGATSCVDCGSPEKIIACWLQTRGCRQVKEQSHELSSPHVKGVTDSSTSSISPQ